MEIKEAEEPKKLDDGDPRFKVVFNAENSGNDPHQIVLRHEGIIPNSEDDTSLVVALTNSSYDGVSVTPYGKIDPGSYDVYYNGKKISNIILPQGGVHTFVVDEVSAQEPKFLDFLLTSENSVHLFWI